MCGETSACQMLSITLLIIVFCMPNKQRTLCKSSEFNESELVMYLTCEEECSLFFLVSAKWMLCDYTNFL